MAPSWPPPRNHWTPLPLLRHPTAHHLTTRTPPLPTPLCPRLLTANLTHAGAGLASGSARALVLTPMGGDEGAGGGSDYFGVVGDGNSYGNGNGTGHGGRGEGQGGWTATFAGYCGMTHTFACIAGMWVIGQ